MLYSSDTRKRPSILEKGYPENTDAQSPDYLPTSLRTTPMDPSKDYPKNRVKKKGFIYCFSNISLMLAKFQVLCWENVTDLGSVSDASYIIYDRRIKEMSKTSIS